MRGSLDLVKYLVDKGANTHATNGEKKTALNLAVSFDFQDIAKYLKEITNSTKQTNWQGDLKWQTWSNPPVGPSTS